jgi:hypothetical protein
MASPGLDGFGVDWLEWLDTSGVTRRSTAGSGRTVLPWQVAAGLASMATHPVLRNRRHGEVWQGLALLEWRRIASSGQEREAG